MNQRNASSRRTQRPVEKQNDYRISYALPEISAGLDERFDNRPVFIEGDAREVLRSFAGDTVDCVITSPPYWGKREYRQGGIGLEKTYGEYVDDLVAVCEEIKRILKPTGSFWLNIGDTYHRKQLLGIPWRVAFRLMDDQGWILRNSVIWNKVKSGMDNSRDRLGNVHELMFHFVKNSTGYFYDADAIRSKPREARVIDGAVVSGTGVSGVRYKRQIELSTELSPEEKTHALSVLHTTLESVRAGEISDFRMIIRGQQRATHSDRPRVSGRAKELADNGFYILRYHPNGSKPSDVWDILPEDTQSRTEHFAAFPEDLCRIPILATCPPGGLVLDPFCGTGTAMLVACRLGRKSIGIDISPDYIDYARNRLKSE